MKMPTKLSTWFMLLFFLAYGLTELTPFFRLGFFEGIFALGAAVFLFLEK